MGLQHFKASGLSWLMRSISSFLLVAFTTLTVLPPAQAQGLNSPQNVLTVSPVYQPAVLQGMVIHPENPLPFLNSLKPFLSLFDKFSTENWNEEREFV